MDISRTSDVWWKNAIFHCLDVETLQDSNGDGVGDFVGLAQGIGGAIFRHCPGQSCLS